MFEERPVRRLFPILLLNLVAFAVAIPILPALALDLGGTATDIGFLFAVQSLGQFAMAPVWGDLSDRYGRKPVLIATIAAGAFFEFLTAAATSLSVLYIARAFTGICAGNIATASALITDATPDHNRSRGMAIIGISFGVGFTLGPALGAGVAMLPRTYTDLFWQGPGILGTGLPFAVAGLIALGTAVAGAFVLEEPTTHAPSETRLGLKERFAALVRHEHSTRIAVMCALFFSYTVANAILEVGFFPYVEAIYGFEEPQVGLIFAGMGLLLALVQGSVGRISDRVGNRRMTAGGVAMMAVGLALAPTYQTLSVLLLFLAVATIGRALAHPGILSLTSALANDPSETGKIMGVLQSASSLGRIVGHVAGGLLFQYIAVDAPFWGAALIVGLAGVIWWLVFPASAVARET